MGGDGRGRMRRESFGSDAIALIWGLSHSLRSRERKGAAVASGVRGGGWGEPIDSASAGGWKREAAMERPGRALDERNGGADGADEEGVEEVSGDG